MDVVILDFLIWMKCTNLQSHSNIQIYLFIHEMIFLKTYNQSFIIYKAELFFMDDSFLPDTPPFSPIPSDLAYRSTPSKIQ